MSTEQVATWDGDDLGAYLRKARVSRQVTVRGLAERLQHQFHQPDRAWEGGP